MIDACTALRRRPDHTRNATHAMIRALRGSLNADYCRQEVAAEDIGVCLKTPQGTPPVLQGKYTTLKRWYCHASARKIHPSKADLEKLSKDYTALYQQEDPYPPGWTISTHVAPFQIKYGVPMEAQVEARAGVHTHLQAEHL